MNDNKKILIVDDEVDFSRMLSFNLQEMGPYQVRTENNPINALSAALQLMPDLIFLYVVMPAMEGADVYYQLRMNHFTRHIPIIFLTATVTPEEVCAQNGKIGGRLFLAKPGEVWEVIECIESNLATHR